VQVELVYFLGDVLLVLWKLNGKVVNLVEHDPAKRGDGRERKEDDKEGGEGAGKAPSFKQDGGWDEKEREKTSEGQRDEDLATEVESSHDEKDSQERAAGRFQDFTNICRHGSPNSYDAGKAGVLSDRQILLSAEKRS
jgi:hypothetical protein